MVNGIAHSGYWSSCCEYHGKWLKSLWLSTTYNQIPVYNFSVGMHCKPTSHMCIFNIITIFIPVYTYIPAPSNIALEHPVSHLRSTKLSKLHGRVAGCSVWEFRFPRLEYHRPGFNTKHEQSLTAGCQWLVTSIEILRWKVNCWIWIEDEFFSWFYQVTFWGF